MKWTGQCETGVMNNDHGHTPGCLDGNCPGWSGRIGARRSTAFFGASSAVRDIPNEERFGVCRRET